MKSPTEISILINKIQEKYSWTMLELSKNLGVTEAALSRWNNGKSFPHRKNFETLKSLAEGNLNQPAQTQAPPDSGSALLEMLGPVLLSLPGRMDQLTKQIADLQAENGRLHSKIGTLEANFLEMAKRKKV